MTTSPTPPSPLARTGGGVVERLGGPRVAVPDYVLERIIRSGVDCETAEGRRSEAARDWWPLSIGWAAEGRVPAMPAAVVRPTTTSQVAEVLAACSAGGVPVTPVAGRSGVCGGSVPLFGGVALDLTSLTDGLSVDEQSLIADVPAGMFGPDLESALRSHGSGYTLGHWPQSMDLSTVGGWLACRGAGQYSTRYGKIEDMVIGLEVVLADGRVVRTEGAGPRCATGPNLTQLFVGSEGTLGVITGARLRIHPLPASEARRSFGFASFADGLDACRRILRRGATPAVLRLYDQAESERNFDRDDTCVLIVLDEGDPAVVTMTVDLVEDECRRAPAGSPLDAELVERWLGHRNDVSALAPLWAAGVVVDTAEVAGRWSVLPHLSTEVLTSVRDIPGTLVASVHQSHAYTDGACLYFTFAGRPPHGETFAPDDAMAWEEDYYRRAWDVVSSTVLRHGAALSHHHGVGLNRGRFMADALGEAFGALASLKQALDPAGVMNPGKLGLPSTFGAASWP